MDEDKLLESFKEYFDAMEVVDPFTYNRHGDRSWKFIDFRLMANVLFMRVAINKPFHVNNWARGGNFDERGLRSNMTSRFKSKTKRDQLYLSAHTMGKALDFHISDMPAAKVRDWAVRNAEYFPYPARFEDKLRGNPISWVHIDTFYERQNPQVYLFNVG